MRRREFITLLGGTAATWPLAAGAQQSPKVARIGLLTEASLESPVVRANFGAVRQEFGRLGYFEGKNVIFEERGADSMIERLPAMAAELVGLKVDVLVVLATQAGRAAQRATNTIPIVIGSMGDPVADGLVATLSHPGGNITGTTFLGPELLPKRLGLLKALIPTMSRVVCLWHPEAFSEQTNGDMKKAMEGAAKALGVRLGYVAANKPDEFERAFSEMASGRFDAMFEFPSPTFFIQRRRLVDLAEQHRLPSIYNTREFVELGGLIAYGANILYLNGRTAVYADKILKGAKPSELPVEQPTEFELAINRKTAKTLGIDIPSALLATADLLVD
jgi:putative tryptophan/tyrosine transport system substrate-binding protein